MIPFDDGDAVDSFFVTAVLTSHLGAQLLYFVMNPHHFICIPVLGFVVGVGSV